MKALSVLRRVIELFLLLLVLPLVGGSGATRPVDAQTRTCYKMVKVETCADMPGTDICKEYPNNEKLAPGTSQSWGKEQYPNDCKWTVTSLSRPAGAEAKCEQGTGAAGWATPPDTWCSDQRETLDVSQTAYGERIMGVKLIPTPRDALNLAGGHQEGCNPFGDGCGVGIGSNDYPQVQIRTGAWVGIAPVVGMKEWTIEVNLYSLYAVDKGARWQGRNQVIYHYEPIPSGSVAPPTNPPVTGSPSGQPKTPEPPKPPNPPPSTGATNTTLPMPPSGQAEPYTNTPGMALQAAQRRVGVGDVVLVPVWLIKGNNVANINYELTYNANVARPEGTIQKGNLLDNALFSVNPNTSGIIRAGFAQTTGVSGTGTVTNIPFRATGKVGDRTPLNLAVTTINDPAGTVLAIDRIPGEIVIVGPEGAVPGDCDGDGKLTMFDAMCALQMSVQLIPVRLVMDMDKSGDVTSRDAVFIAQKFLALIP